MATQTIADHFEAARAKALDHAACDRCNLRKSDRTALEFVLTKAQQR